MHILVVNDDGPPSAEHSPYVRTLVATLQSRGHVVSVVLPDQQRSWIGKAHLIGARITPSYLLPAPFVPSTAASHDPAAPSHMAPGSRSATPLPAGSAEEEWVLVDGTPASCAQLGLHHLFAKRGKIDLVVSGPNFGRNSTAVYSLSSGTIGGAMEAAHCGARAIALSWAYDAREHDPAALEAAGRHSVRVVEWLAANWGGDVDVYNVNVPVRKEVEGERVMVTTCLHNSWGGTSAFRPVEGQAAPDSEAAALKDKVRREDERADTPVGAEQHARFEHRAFEWAPSHTAVRKTVSESTGNNDGRTLLQGWTSITPLRAAFMEATAHPLGELTLTPAQPRFLAYIAYDSPYVQPIIQSAFSSLFPHTATLLPNPLPPSAVSSTLPYLHIAPYESLHHDLLLSRPRAYFANSYTYRKALIRKHHLPHVVAHHVAKNPGDPLAMHVPVTVDLEVDYAEFLDDALVEAWELKEAWARSADKAPAEREWWILKPSMSDQGQGIRLFSSEAELQAIFEEWEEDGDSGESDDDTGGGAADGIVTSHLRHFVAQPYIDPLILAGLGGRKFHLRSYVLALGALRVSVYGEMLALFAGAPYTRPASSAAADMAAHLTNTCLQGGEAAADAVRLLSALPLAGSAAGAGAVRDTVCACTASLFRAAAAQATHFQPAPNAFEVFGVDWLVDARGQPWMLEVNAFPDFAMSGDEGRGVVEGVWKGVLARVGAVLGVETETEDEWIEVLNLDMGRG